MPRRAKKTRSAPLDTDLEDLPADLRWRIWMGRAEAVIFAAQTPATREMIARVVGKSCSVEALIDDIRAELTERPYELVKVAGGWQHRTRKSFTEAIDAATGLAQRAPTLSPLEGQVLAAVAYFQPITRADIGAIFGREISRDTLADLRALKLIASGPRSPRPGAPLTYVTTAQFLTLFGLDSLSDLPDREQLEDEGLSSLHRPAASPHDAFPLPIANDAGIFGDDGEPDWPGRDPIQPDP